MYLSETARKGERFRDMKEIRKVLTSFLKDTRKALSSGAME